MIDTSEEDPILKEFGLDRRATSAEKAAAVLAKETKQFITISASSFALYNFTLLFQDIKMGKQIGWKENAKFSAMIGCNIAGQETLTTLIADTIAMSRGRRAFYDPIIGGTIAGAVFEYPNGWESMKRGAVNGAMTQAMLSSFTYALRKLSETQQEEEEEKKKK